MLNLLKEYSKILDREEYKEFKKENPNSFLISVFLDDKGFQFNFYYSKKLITFYLEGNDLKTEESEVYKSDEGIKELNLDDVKLNLEKAEEIMNKVLEKENKKEVNKKIIILQQKEVPLWNITYITGSMDVLNLKISAIDGKILDQRFENILKFQGK